MECREAREFFSPYLDGELTTEEKDMVQQHLATCPACREEMARWEELSRALRGLKAPVVAPPGFAAAVMARVAGLRQVRPWRQARQLVAAAAAVAVLAAGSIGYAARGFWQQLPGSIIAAIHQGHDRSGQQVAVNPSDKVATPGSSVPGNGDNPASPPDAGTATNPNTLPGMAGPQPGNANVSPGNGPAGNQPGKNAKTNNAPGNTAQQPGGSNSDQQPTRVAGNDPYPARSFLSTGRQVTSTMLKVGVADMAAARAKALSLGGSSGAAVQVIADQDNGQEKRFISQFTVPEDRAAGLLAGLEGLGQVTSRNTSNQDLTQQFSATLEQYQAKVAQVNAATDPAEKEKLQGEAQALERQLSTWEQETKQQTIILWLETK